MTSISRRTRRGSVIQSPAEYRAVAIVDLFREYAKHPPFRTDLTALADDVQPMVPDLRPFRGHVLAAVEARAKTDDRLASYVDAVRSVAATWGLDRVDGSTGIEAVHRWVVDYRLQDPDEDGASFGYGLAYDSIDPGVDMTVHVEDGFEWDPEAEPRVDSDVEIPDRVVSWLLDDRGFPAPLRAVYGWRMRDYPTGVRTRVMNDLKPEQATAVDGELDRIQGEYETLGWVYADAEPQYKRNLTWTFLRVARSFPVWKIAEAGDVSEDRVYKETGMLARRIGIRDFPKTDRKPELKPRSKTLY